MALADLLFPCDSLVKPGGEPRPGISSELVCKLKWKLYFADDNDDKLTYLFYTTWAMKDDEILEWIEEEAGFILLPRMVDIFARSRWIGGQEVGQAVAVLGVTHHLLEHCLPQWLDEAPPSDCAPRVHAAENTSLAVYDSDSDLDARADMIVPAQEPEENATDDANLSNKTHEFFKKKKQQCISLALPFKEIELIIFCMINKHMNRGLRVKLYIASAKFDLDNDHIEACGGKRDYRLTAAGSNRTECEAAQAAFALLCVSTEWLSLPQRGMTIKYRVLAFSALTMQQGYVVINLKTKQEGSPHNLFSAALFCGRAAQLEVADMCDCMKCEFAAYWLTAYPSEEFTKGISRGLMQQMALDVRTETTSSENGHAYWQAVCRARSLQTHSDTLERVSVTSLQRLSRKHEAKDEIQSLPKKLGRTPKPKVRKDPGTTKKTRAYKSDGRRKGLMQPYQLFVREHPTPNVFGAAQLADKKTAYRDFKQSAEFANLQLRACAITEKQQATHLAVVGPTCVVENETSVLACSVGGSTSGSDSFATMPLCELRSVCTVNALLDEKIPIEQLCTKVRRVVRQLNATCRVKRHKKDKLLADWVTQHTEAHTDALNDNSVDIAGAEVRPNSGTVSRVHLKLPCIKLAIAIAASIGEPRTEIKKNAIHDTWERINTHHTLRKRWAKRHNMYRHREQRHSGEVKPSKYTSSLSRQVGMCLCGRVGLVSFRACFVGALRLILLKKHKNPMKELVEGNRAIFRFCWFNVDSPADSPPDKVSITINQYS